MGGIEAEAVMLGQPMSMVLPEVIGYRLTGELPQLVTATDLVLTITRVRFKNLHITGQSPIMAPCLGFEESWCGGQVRRILWTWCRDTFCRR